MLRRPKSQSLTVTFSFLSLLVFFLCACDVPGLVGGTTHPMGNSSPIKGGIWIDDLYDDPGSLIPNGSAKNASYIIDQSIYTPLFYGDSNGTLHPGLAKEIPTIANGGISPDLKTWTFHLKPNLVWSDGMPLNANDVDFTWKLWNNAHFNAASTPGFNLISSA